MGGFDYVAVPWPTDIADPQPVLRAELEAAGFTLLGGIAVAASAEREIERMARSYGPERRQVFADRSRLPGQVFAAPDRSAFAKLAWFWDCRYAVLTTVLPDGDVVETMADWSSDPVWPTSLAPHYARTTDRRREQLLLATDLDAEVVQGGAAEVWDAHRRRLARRGGGTPDHSSLEDFVRLYAVQSSARSVWARRVRMLTAVVALLIALAAYVLLSAVVPSSSWLVTLGLAAVAVVLCSWVNTRMFLRIRHWRGLRPAFRAPVPGVDRATS